MLLYYTRRIMKKIFITLSVIFTCISLTWCGNYISKKEAQNAALLDAWFTRDQVRFIDTELDYEDGIYDVEFIADGKYRYEYEINARNGEVMVDMTFDLD